MFYSLTTMYLVTGKTGSASVESLALTPCMLDHIQICPIQWDVSLNGSPANQDEATSLALHKPLQLSVSVINKMGEFGLHTTYIQHHL